MLIFVWFERSSIVPIVCLDKVAFIVGFFEKLFGIFFLKGLEHSSEFHFIQFIDCWLKKIAEILEIVKVESVSNSVDQEKPVKKCEIHENIHIPWRDME